MQVRVYNNNIEAALRILTKKMGMERIVQTAKWKRYHEKPSDKRRRKIRESARRRRQALSRQTKWRGGKGRQ